jgi:DegV family protein with EDD domain
MLHIVTDGAADMPQEWQQEFWIDVIPINIRFGEKSYLQGVDLDNEGFYRLVDESGKVPKTSQPSPHQFIEFYERIARVGDTILSVHVTSRLSGTFASATAAARELAGRIRILPFDSGCGSAGLGLMCRNARLLERAGATIEQIVQKLESAREQVRIVLALDTLTYALMSGRVGALQAVLASILNVKPIACLREGVIEVTEKVRTRSASLDRILQMAREQVQTRRVHIAVVHARDPKSGQALLERVREMFNVADLVLTDLSVSVAANLGPGTVGLVLYPVEE